MTCGAMILWHDDMMASHKGMTAEAERPTQCTKRPSMQAMRFLVSIRTTSLGLASTQSSPLPGSKSPKDVVYWQLAPGLRRGGVG
jgi:hypothetical protein